MTTAMMTTMTIAMTMVTRPQILTRLRPPQIQTLMEVPRLELIVMVIAEAVEGLFGFYREQTRCNSSTSSGANRAHDFSTFIPILFSTCLYSTVPQLLMFDIIYLATATTDQEDSVLRAVRGELAG